ncbi:MAG TPA: TorF family putative porin [Cellvibrio sp.]|nr:TorF family putative porin [Cellvibrio sp.]
MKKMKQKFLASAVALSALAGFAVPAVNAAEVGATVSVANMYYWRGLDLGMGDPALIGDVNVTSGGLYAGLWASSGDYVNGTEYDFYAGYKFSAENFFVDFNYTTYMYPSRTSFYDPAIVEAEIGEPIENFGFHDVSDVAVIAGFTASENVSFKLMHRIGVGDILGDDDYTYTTVSGTFSNVTVLYGTHSDESGTYDGLSHLDVSYAYNDKLSFTLGKVVDQGEGDTYNDELKFVVTLSLPIK